MQKMRVTKKEENILKNKEEKQNSYMGVKKR
jgi:hypothetical protein